jgi:hypothetical protein
MRFGRMRQAWTKTRWKQYALEPNFPPAQACRLPNSVTKAMPSRGCDS